MARHKIDPGLIPPAPGLLLEKEPWEQGYHLVAGIDEVGRGALAGPVFAAMVVLPHEYDVTSQLSGIRDSKQMTPAQRASAVEKIRTVALSYGIGEATAEEIDEIGIVQATRLAMKRAIANSPLKVDFLLIDGLSLPEVNLPQNSFIKGDRRSLSIACASVLAKTSRDRVMEEYGKLYPGYHFEINKGYGTRKHLEGINHHGPCPIHRRTFSPLNQN